MVVSFMVCLQFVSCAVYMETARMLEGCRVGASSASSEDLTYPQWSIYLHMSI